MTSYSATYSLFNKEEYDETHRLMKKYEKAADGGILGYAEKINFLENSPEFLRYEIFDSFKDDIDALRKSIAEETDEGNKAKLEAAYYGSMRELVDALHDPESFVKKLYEAGMLSDETAKSMQSKYKIDFPSSKRQNQQAVSQ